MEQDLSGLKSTGILLLGDNEKNIEKVRTLRPLASAVLNHFGLFLANSLSLIDEYEKARNGPNDLEILKIKAEGFALKYQQLNQDLIRLRRIKPQLNSYSLESEASKIIDWADSVLPVMGAYIQELSDYVRNNSRKTA